MKTALFLTVAAACGLSRAAVFDVREFGAKGDGVAKDTAAIQKAVDAATAAGGGEVFLGAGTYVSGSLFLKSNVDFHLGPGARILGSPDPADYNAPDVCPQNSRGSKNESAFGAHLFLCIEQTNVVVRGPGTIDGNSAVFLINPETGLPWGHVKDDPVKRAKWYGQNMIKWRPSQMLYFVECDGVRLLDLNLRNSTYWSCFLHGCEHVQVRGLDIRNERKRFHTHNGDGIDIDSCRFVTVSDCLIDTADDCITLRNDCERLKSPRDCAYVTVGNCVLSTPCNCVRLGVGKGLVHDVTLADIVVHDARTAVNFVTAWRPTATEGVDFRNVRLANWAVDCEILCHMYGGPLAKGVKRRAFMRDIYFDGFSGKAVRDSEIRGCDAASPIERIHFRNVDVDTTVQVSNARLIDVSGGTLKIREGQGQ